MSLKSLLKDQKINKSSNNAIVVKKSHTCYRSVSKWLLISDATKRILLISPVYEGKTHDFAIFKDLCSGLDFILDLSRWQVQVDLGFLGIDKQVRCDQLFIPFKASKNHPLDDIAKEYNSIISSMRIKVEHALANLKSFFILRIKNRMRKRAKLDDVFGLCAALANFRLNTLTINT